MLSDVADAVASVLSKQEMGMTSVEETRRKPKGFSCDRVTFTSQHSLFHTFATLELEGIDHCSKMYPWGGHTDVIKKMLICHNVTRSSQETVTV